MTTRSSHQRGWVESRKRGKGKRVYIIRWYERDASSPTGWRKRSRALRDCPSKKVAQRELEGEMQRVNRRNGGLALTGGPVLTFAAYARGLWVDYQEKEKVKPSTRYVYKSMLGNHLLPALGEYLMEEITPLTVSELFAGLRAKGLSEGYQLNIYAMLNVMFEIALEFGLVQTSPVRKRLHRPKPRKKEKPVLTAADFQKLVFFIPDCWKPLIFCAASTGLRAGELLGLRWRDFDATAGKLHVRNSLWRGRLGSPKTRSSNRVIWISPELSRVLEAHRRESDHRGGSDFIFCRPDGRPCDADVLRSSVLYPAMDRAGIARGSRTHGFHLFRHTAASIVHQRTGSLKHAQLLLGHAHLDTTANVYVHVDEQQAKEAAAAVSQALLSSCPLLAQHKASTEVKIQ